MISQTLNTAIRLTEYDQLETFARAFAEGSLNLMIVVGRPGIAKSETIRNCVKDACWIEGTASAFGMYQALHEHKDKLVCIDDVDSLYSDKAAVRLLKSLCQTRESKTLRWLTNAAAKNDLPTSFETTSSVCIIANEWSNLNANVDALVDRGHFLHFDPTNDQVHAKVKEWFDDDEVYSWFDQHLALFPALSMRSYVKAKELKAAEMDWKAFSLSHLGDKERALVGLLGRNDFENEAARVEEFQLKTGASRATYFNIKKKFVVSG